MRWNKMNQEKGTQIISLKLQIKSLDESISTLMDKKDELELKLFNIYEG